MIKIIIVHIKMIMNAFQWLKTKVSCELPNIIILRTAPPALISTFLAILPHVGGDNYSKWAGVETVDTLMQIGTILVLMGSTLAYLAIMFNKEWQGYWHWKKRKRVFHQISFGVIGVAAALVPYLGNVATYFFVIMDHEFGGRIQEYLPLLSIYTGIASCIAIGIFNGILGHGFFKIVPINRSPLKKYSWLEYKIRKQLPEYMNRIIFINN